MEPSETLVTGAGSEQPALRSVRVVVESGPDAGAAVALQGTVLVGSDKAVELPLTDPRVSRRHVELQLRDDGIRVRDLGSKNGTFLGDARVETVCVAAGARVRLGATTLRFAVEERAVDLGAREAFGALRTRSPALQRVFALLERAARSDATILLGGETGVGKDLLARTIHAESPRRAAPFVVLDCGAASGGGAEGLLGSQLFGHKKGAFTGAVDDREGVFETARGGTVFLDEIGELPLELQPQLLRVLESRTVTRLGETKPRAVDARIVAATHRELAAEVERGAFRSDLFFRLAVIRTRVPPLRERRDDLEPLIAHFLDELGRPGQRFSREDVACMRDYSWPGNVRELRNVIEQSAALSDKDRLTLFGALDGPGAAAGAADDGGDDDDVARAPYKDAREAALARFEGRYVRGLLRAHGDNVSHAARAAGIDRHYLHKLMRRHGIKRGGADDAAGER